MAQSNETTQASWRCIGLLSGYIPLFRGRVPWEQKASKREFNTVHGGRNIVYSSAYWGDSHFPIQSYKWYYVYSRAYRAAEGGEMHSTLSCIFLSYMQANLRKRATSCETPLILVLLKLSPLIFKPVRASDFILGSWTHRDFYFTNPMFYAVDSLLSEVVAIQQEVSNSRFSTTGSMHARHTHTGNRKGLESVASVAE